MSAPRHDRPSRRRHVWNVFLPQAGGDDVLLFDWDRWRIGVGTSDLAYMMALHWFPDHRRRYEGHLLDYYHAELLVHGVTGYDRRALDDDYRLSVLWQIVTPMAGGPLLGYGGTAWSASF